MEGFVIRGGSTGADFTGGCPEDGLEGEGTGAGLSVDFAGGASTEGFAGAGLSG